MKGPGKLLPPIVVGVMGNTGIYLVPLMLGAMVSDRGFTEQQAGLVASADLAGYATTTFATAMFLIRKDWRQLALTGIVVMILANLGSIFVTSGVAFAAVRFLSGMGAGVLAAIATVSLGRSKSPDRGYGLLFAASLLFGSAGLWGLPVLMERTGLNGAYVFIAVLALLAGVVSRNLEQGSDGGEPETSAAGNAKRASPLPAVLVLTSIAIFWAQQNALYAYMERIGDAAGLTGSFIGFALGFANLSGFVGAALVAWMGARFGRRLPLALSTVLQLVCLWLLSRSSDPSGYLFSVALISLCWNVVNPIQIGILAEVDDGGRMLALSSTVIGVGLASGPALGAAVLTGTDYSRVLWLCGALSIVTAVLAVPALTGARKRQLTHAA
jgi:predicted MFS family arabinose efflux permease